MRFLLRVVVAAIAIWLSTLVVSGVVVEATGDEVNVVVTYLVVGLLFALVNAVVKPIVRFLAFPLYILTLGLLAIVVNALMLLLTSWLASFTPFGFHVDGFWSAALGAIVISISTVILNIVFRND